jgi:3-hydroxyacyl-CoA dehydrogenase
MGPAVRPAVGLPGVEVVWRGEVAVVRFGTPHPGAWSAVFRAGVIALLRLCRAEAGRVVLTGARLFEGEGGADLPDFTDLLAVLDGPGAAVVAAIPGAAMGPGLELALACHGRAGVRGTRMGLPGIGLGVLPVNGGVGRLVGQVGAAVALEMIGFGEVVPAGVALRLGLPDAVAEVDVVAAAVGLVAREPAVPGRADAAALRLGLRRRAPGQAAPLAALRAIEQAGSLPVARGASDIRRLAVALRGSDEGVALRHAAGCAGLMPEGGGAGPVALGVAARGDPSARRRGEPAGGGSGVARVRVRHAAAGRGGSGRARCDRARLRRSDAAGVGSLLADAGFDARCRADRAGGGAGVVSL